MVLPIIYKNGVSSSQVVLRVRGERVRPETGGVVEDDWPEENRDLGMPSDDVLDELLAEAAVSDVCRSRARNRFSIQRGIERQDIICKYVRDWVAKAQILRARMVERSDRVELADRNSQGAGVARPLRVLRKVIFL